MVDTKSHWEKIYHDKQPSETSWYPKEPILSSELIRNTGLTHDAPIIDVGGGASVLVDCLCKEGYTDVTVLDISAQSLAYARDRLGEIAGNVKWIEADVTQFDGHHQFRLWHDRAVFHFLTLKSEREDYVSSLKRTLKPGGHLIIATFAVGGPTKCSGLDIVQYDAEKIHSEFGEDFEMIEERNEVHRTLANKEQKFAYFRLIRRS